MDWYRVMLSLDQSTREYNSRRDTHQAYGNMDEAWRLHTVAEITGVLAAALRFGDKEGAKPETKPRVYNNVPLAMQQGWQKMVDDIAWNNISNEPTPETDSALFLRKWAADIRKSSGVSVDADRLDGIASEIDELKGR